MTQTDLAHATGVSFQQIQKYENGFNRVSASKLFLLAQTVGRPVEWFFEGLGNSENDVKIDTPEPIVLRAVERETLHALRNLPADCQTQIIQLIRVLSQSTPNEGEGET